MLHRERTKDADLIGLTSRWDDARTVLRCRQPAGPSKTSMAKIGQDCYKMYFSMRRGIRWIKMEWLQPDDWKTLKDLVLMTSPARSPKSNGRFRDDLSQESGRPGLHCHEPNLLNLIRWRNAPTGSAETSNARTSTRFHKSSEQHCRHARMRWDFIDRLRSTVMQRRSKAPWSSTSTAICPAQWCKDTYLQDPSRHLSTSHHETHENQKRLPFPQNIGGAIGFWDRAVLSQRDS